MIEGLIGLLIVILIVAVVIGVLVYCVSLMPIDPPFAQMARAVLILIGALIIIFKALPLLGVAVL